MNYATEFPGDYLEGEMLPQDRPVTVVISKIDASGTVKAADGTLIERPIIHFEPPAKRALIANKTNCRAIARLYGPTMTDWIGKEIQLIQRRIDCFGEKNYPVCRVIGAVDRKKGRKR